jgi:hypothetical protein
MASITTKKYLSKSFNTPFYDKNSGTYKVKIKVSSNALAGGVGSQFGLLSIKEQGARAFVSSYLPEFYSYLFDEEYFQEQANGDLDLAESLIEEITNSVQLETSYQTSPPGPMSIVIVRTLYNFDDKREELLSEGNMPDFEPNLVFFNQRLGIEGEISETTLTVGTLGEQNNLLNNGLRMFDTQYAGFEGQINLNVAFGPLQIQATKTLNRLVTLLSEQLKTRVPSYDFSEADTITLIFGKKDGKLAISRIEYLLVEESIQSQPLRLGYFPIIENSNLLNDPMTLTVLRNYQNLLTSIQDTIDTNSPYSFYDFLNDDTVKDSLGFDGNIIENFQIQPKKDMTNELLRVANDYGLIDVNNVDDLEKGFKDYFTSEEYKKLKREVADNPEVFKRVAAAQTVKALNTAAQVSEVIGNVIDQGPLGLIEKANPKVAYIMRQFGIDEIAREAFVCLTFGASVEAGRINKAVRNALVRVGSSIYYPPDAPKEAPISLPEVDLSQFQIFTVSGELWKEIEKVIVDTVQQTVLEVIKTLADLLRENCALTTPRSSDYGENDLTDFIEDNPNPGTSLLPTVGAGSQLDQLSGKNGLSNQQILEYLSALSSILSSIDICILLLNRDDASDELIDRILEFNRNYDDEDVARRLNSRTDILGFFEDLSGVVDVTSLCNEIANELYETNQNNVCLDEGIFDDENIQELLDLIENGLQVNPPNIDLECPDSQFLDPTITKSIPETFNALAETVQLQFIASGDSVKEIMLEPVQKNQSRVLDDIRQVNTGSIGDPINTEFLAKIVGVLQQMQDGYENLEEQLQQCDVDLSRFLGTDGAADLTTIGTIAGAVSESITDPNFRDAVQSIINNVENLANPDYATNPVFTAYDFNQNFLNAFRDYIQPEKFVYNPEDLQTVMEKFYSSFVLEGDPLEYRNLELLFRFAEEAPTLDLDYGGNDIPLSVLQDLASIELAPDEHIHFFTEFTGSNDYVIHNHSLDLNDGIHDTQNGTYTDGHVHPFSPGLQPATLDIPTVAEDFSQALVEVGPGDVLSASFGAGTGIEDPGRIPDSLSLNYPPFGLTDPQLTIDFNLDRFFQDNAEDEILGGEKAATAEEYFVNNQLISSSVSETANVFVNKFATAIIDNLNSVSLAEEQEVYYSDFPRVYGQLVENAFEYVLKNGVFDAATLQSLNFFTQTENCPPSELGDFLDIQGIINQMIEEYKESACSGEDVPLSSKIRNVIKFGMYLLLVQIHIAEVIIKNIFVMSAYNLDSILDRNSFVFTFIRGQILQSLLFYFDAIEPSAENRIRMDLTSYFNLKARRSVVAQRGGILYLDGTVAIPAGTQFSITDEDTFFGFDEILDFLISDRIDRSRQVINNALRKALPNTNQLSFNESMLRTLPGITVENDEPSAISSVISQLTPSSLRFLNIPEVGLLMTMKLSGENAAAPASDLYENLLTSDREQQNLDPLPVSESDFTQGTVPFVSLTPAQGRYLNGTVITNTETNRIFVHVTLGPGVMGDEFQALNTARAEINNTYPNAFLTEAVPVLIISYPGNVLRYGWQVKGTLDTTLQQDTEDSFSTNTQQEEDVTGRRYFKLWVKKGQDVYLLLDLGYRNEGIPPITSDDAQGLGGMPIGGLPTMPS